MIPRRLALVLLAPFTLCLLKADVTLRYKTEVKMNPGLPAQMAAGAQGMGSAMQQEMVLRLKGAKGFSASAAFNSITDFATRQITLLDPAARRYAKTTSDQFAEELARAMPEVPAGARAAMASMKASVTPARLTGRTAVIQGVETEEREFTISVEGPAMPNMPPGPTVRMVLQLWSAKAAEVGRVPAVRELTSYSLWSYATMNPAGAVSRMMKQLPGFSDAFEPLMKEIQKGTPMLRMHMDMFMPAIARMLQGSNPDAPFMQMDQEAAELSAAPVPDSVFQIPEGYQETTGAELIKSVIQRNRAAARQ